MSDALKLIGGSVAVVLAMLLGGCLVIGDFAAARFKEARQTSLPHEPGSAICVLSDNGAISIARGPGNDVQITANLSAISQERLAAAQVLTERANGKLTIHVEWPDGKRKNGEGCGFTITLPEAKGVEARTSNGAINITGLGGDASLHTSNGAITAIDQAGSVEGRSSNGRISVRNASGDVLARTSNGAVEIEDARRRVDVETSNGSANVQFAGDGAGPAKIQSSNGAVDLTVGPAFAGELRVSTSNGRIDIGALSNARTLSANKDSARLVLGDGGAVSDINTSNGSIRVRGVAR